MAPRISEGGSDGAAAASPAVEKYSTARHGRHSESADAVRVRRSSYVHKAPARPIRARNDHDSGRARGSGGLPVALHGELGPEEDLDHPELVHQPRPRPRPSLSTGPPTSAARTPS